MDPLILFHRICVAKQSDEDLKMFFTFELSPFPLSLFSEEGMRKGTKSSLFSAFTPTKIDAVQGKNNFVVVNGGNLLHKVVWHRNMDFGDIAKSYLTYLQTHYGSNVAVVFDGYPSDVNGKSTKSTERTKVNFQIKPDNDTALNIISFRVLLTNFQSVFLNPITRLATFHSKFQSSHSQKELHRPTWVSNPRP
ncbi:hypothetical protein AVEN_78672-1 [Araneus ventricosus]|uniref:Uncharacterized protein n=1 Tax=Araneus ventricosus TaxID=182803 RepID=A0A4Y2W3Y6_ARAVE|nr:hypothetical protein AVEN_78672-1 [Araneus ventricosus]